ncbi:copper chaperone PCu(A)C [Niveibacterium umoris]|uniref:Copper chaperone PCu(A)C n=1 Tax=Niveibacterium umoris TaxID=1193620 RepID=A0A840BKD1_9RHOO|nr:copper chaperone PCu(A)C [Niveibacterium umoris]MBB4014011.1 hypothetical protein [Niveibacterium umoris]
MRSLLLATLLALGAASAGAADLKIEGAWVRGTTPSQKATGAFMTLTSTGDAALVGAASPVAGKVEIHEMKMVGDTMKMGAIAKLPLPAGKPVELKPGSYHVMLLDLKKEMKEGSKVPLTLEIETGGKREQVAVEAEVRPLGDASAHKHMQH